MKMERLKLFQVARNFINFGKERKEENRERKEKTEARRTVRVLRNKSQLPKLTVIILLNIPTLKKRNSQIFKFLNY